MRALNLLLILLVAGAGYFLWSDAVGPQPDPPAFERAARSHDARQSPRLPATRTSASAREARHGGSMWGNPATLRDHFERHGGDFGAKDENDYARMANAFLQRAKTAGLPAKVDDEGVVRVFDPANNSFAAYNRDETTKTYFKARNRGYFERQPGRFVNLRTSK